ncbi:hypothetical protein RUM44_011404 [Polyplax serrata]|uniref:Uncharacterized protein n=1 Tax=Polyplax serrata TaxID=468196 RepID=A0ABR1AQ00_POLSC
MLKKLLILLTFAILQAELVKGAEDKSPSAINRLVGFFKDIWTGIIERLSKSKIPGLNKLISSPAFNKDKIFSPSPEDIKGEDEDDGDDDNYENKDDAEDEEEQQEEVEEQSTTTQSIISKPSYRTWEINRRKRIPSSIDSDELKSQHTTEDLDVATKRSARSTNKVKTTTKARKEKNISAPVEEKNTTAVETTEIISTTSYDDLSEEILNFNDNVNGLNNVNA